MGEALVTARLVTLLCLFDPGSWTLGRPKQLGFVLCYVLSDVTSMELFLQLRRHPNARLMKDPCAQAELIRSASARQTSPALWTVNPLAPKFKEALKHLETKTFQQANNRCAWMMGKVSGSTLRTH